MQNSRILFIFLFFSSRAQATVLDRFKQKFLQCRQVPGYVMYKAVKNFGDNPFDTDGELKRVARDVGEFIVDDLVTFAIYRLLKNSDGEKRITLLKKNKQRKLCSDGVSLSYDTALEYGIKGCYALYVGEGNLKKRSLIFGRIVGFRAAAEVTCACLKGLLQRCGVQKAGNKLGINQLLNKYPNITESIKKIGQETTTLGLEIGLCLFFEQENE